MTIIIEIYIIVCVMLLLFDIGFLLVKNGHVNNLLPKHSDFSRQLQQEIERHQQEGRFSESFLSELPAKLSKTKNLIALQDVGEKDPDMHEQFRDAVFAQYSVYCKKSNYEQAYYTYVISTFDYQRREVPGDFGSDLLSFLDSKSLYTFTNTMSALYAFGEVSLLIQAMDKINARSGFYHKKLLIDGLLSAKVDHSQLNHRLLERFDSYTPYVQDCLLDYFRMGGFDCSALCLRLMDDSETDTQVRYSAMRYFAKLPCEDSRQRFLALLEKSHTVWVEEMLAIQALSCYGDPTVRELIRSKVTDSSWFVRVNAVEYLYRHGMTREQVFDILYLRDRYANEALLYQYRGDKEMSRYIIDTIQLLEQQATSIDASEHAEEAALAAAHV